MIAPSILSADFTKLAEEIKKIEAAKADMLHIDIMDGHFVPNISFGPAILKQIRSITGMFLDVHLMLTNPENYIDIFHEAGSDCITVHTESTYHIHRLLGLIKSKGIKAGVSLNPGTPVCMLNEIIHLADIVLVMTVNPGFGGQSFISEGLVKIQNIKKLIDEKGSQSLIQVDGGVNAQTAPLLWQAGADILVAGNAVFTSGDYSKAVASLRLKA